MNLAQNTITHVASNTVNTAIEIFSKTLDALGPFGPYLVAVLIFLIGRWIALKVRKILVHLFEKTSVNQRLNKVCGSSMDIGGFIASIVYAVLLLFVLTLALNKAGLKDASAPLTEMIGSIFDFLPKLLGAGVVAFFAFFGAKVVKNLIESVLLGVGLDKRLGAKDEQYPLTKSLSTFAYCFVILFFVPAILDKLSLDEIATPIKSIVAAVMSSIPHIIIASVVLGVGILIASIVRRLLSNLIEASGANKWPSKIGLDIPQEGSKSLSSVVSFLVMLTIVVAVVSQSVELLGLPLLTELTSGLMDGYLNLLACVLIFGFGLLAGKFAFTNLADKNVLLAKLARAAIIILTGVVALERSQIAPDLTGLPFVVAIVALGFAGGVGGAIAFGLGGKDFIARWLEKRG